MPGLGSEFKFLYFSYPLMRIITKAYLTRSITMSALLNLNVLLLQITLEITPTSGAVLIDLLLVRDNSQPVTPA